MAGFRRRYHPLVRRRPLRRRFKSVKRIGRYGKNRRFVSRPRRFVRRSTAVSSYRRRRARLTRGRRRFARKASSKGLSFRVRRFRRFVRPSRSFRSAVRSTLSKNLSFSYQNFGALATSSASPTNTSDVLSMTFMGNNDLAQMLSYAFSGPATAATNMLVNNGSNHFLPVFPSSLSLTPAKIMEYKGYNVFIKYAQITASLLNNSNHNVFVDIVDVKCIRDLPVDMAFELNFDSGSQGPWVFSSSLLPRGLPTGDVDQVPSSVTSGNQPVVPLNTHWSWRMMPIFFQYFRFVTRKTILLRPSKAQTVRFKYPVSRTFNTMFHMLQYHSTATSFAGSHPRCYGGLTRSLMFRSRCPPVQQIGNYDLVVPEAAVNINVTRSIFFSIPPDTRSYGIRRSNVIVADGTATVQFNSQGQRQNVVEGTAVPTVSSTVGAASAP